MGTYRIYTDDDAIARWEEIDLEKVPTWTNGIDVTQIRFGSRQPGVLQDWHPCAPSGSSLLFSLVSWRSGLRMALKDLWPRRCSIGRGHYW